MSENSDWIDRYNKRLEDRKNVFKNKLPLWCKFFKENGIKQVLCEYEGSGDSGCIENVYFFKEYNEDRSSCGYHGEPETDEVKKDKIAKLKIPDNLKQETWIPQEEGEAKWGIPDKYQDVYDAYDYWASEALPNGFEVNDGGFGTLDLNVAECRMEVEANTRMTHYETETYEFSKEKEEDVDGASVTSRDK